MYTSCYCEENVYKFIEENSEHFDDMYAVFVSNPRKQCAIWYQKSSNNPAVTPMCWDYHVIVVAKKSFHFYVYDLDSTLPFPSDFKEYFSRCFWPSSSGVSPWWLQFAIQTGHYFRPVNGHDFLSKFSSDRRHMIDNATGQWHSPPPEYQPIFKPDLGCNLMDFLDFKNTSLPGKWLDYSQFLLFLEN